MMGKESRSSSVCRCLSKTWLSPRRFAATLSKREAFIPVLGNRVAAFAIVVETAEIDSELSGLTWNVGAEIPGIRLGIERAGRDFGRMGHPTLLRIGRRFDH